jgi:hypothetical protein
LIFHNKCIYYGEGLLAPLPTPKLEDHSLPFLHPQPEDAPCCDNRDQPNVV